MLRIDAPLFCFCFFAYLTDDTAHGDDLAANDDRLGTATLLNPELGTRTWKALLLGIDVLSNARTAVAVESALMGKAGRGTCVSDDLLVKCYGTGQN